MKILIDSLYKSYDGKSVFQNFSLDIEFDGILLIRGKSGLGKTTLLRMLAGLEKPDSGTVKTDAKKISFMFQEDRLIPFVSVLKNVAAVNAEKAKEYLVLLGLQNELDSSPATLSGGMKRRVSLARALAFDSDLVILDEPFKGLDGELKADICKAIRAESESRPFIAVSHDTADGELLNAKILDLDEIMVDI